LQGGEEQAATSMDLGENVLVLLPLIERQRKLREDAEQMIDSKKKRLEGSNYGLEEERLS
jgi:hypothetical protein